MYYLVQSLNVLLTDQRISFNTKKTLPLFCDHSVFSCHVTDNFSTAEAFSCDI
jgi:hypothetical protein